MDPSQQTRPITFEEYLELEEASPIKHELVAGYMFEYNGSEVRGLAGATRQHNSISMNIAAQLWNAAAGGPCRVFGSDMKLRVHGETGYYPDIQVVCDPSDAAPLYTTRPCLIVEVLSPSTAAVDRREKLLEYQSLDSLQAYLIAWSDERRCLLHYRGEDGQWLSAFKGADDVIALHCPELTLSLEQIYTGVSFAD